MTPSRHDVRRLIPCCSRCSTAAPASKQSRSLSSDIAACAELFGKLIPSASIAEAMVFAVYIPPHEPSTGNRASPRSPAARLSRHLAAGMFAHRLEHGDDIDILFSRCTAGQDRSAVDEHRRPIQPRHRDQAARHVLVAAADRHQAVHPLAADDRLRSNRRSPRATPASISSPRSPSKSRRKS